MTRLVFNMEQVAGIAEHFRNSPARRMTVAQRARIYGDDRCDAPQPGEGYRTPLCLWLVKDEGIYLMSPGYDPAKPRPPGERAPVAHALGFDPERQDRGDVWDRAREAVGGDFSEEIPLEWIDAALRSRPPQFVVDFTADDISLLLPADRQR